MFRGKLFFTMLWECVEVGQGSRNREDIVQDFTILVVGTFMPSLEGCSLVNWSHRCWWGNPRWWSQG